MAAEGKELEYLIPEVKMRKMTITGVNDVVEGATYVLPYFTKLDNEEQTDKTHSGQTKPRRSIIYIHGGGFVWGTPKDYAEQCQFLFKSTKVDALYFIDYSLAPQFKFPRGLDECVALSKWIFQHSDELDIDRDQIQMVGDSAGGNLVLATALQLLTEKEKYPVKAVHSLYPILQFVYQLPSAFINRDDETAGLSHQAVSRFVPMYLLGDPMHFKNCFDGNHLSAAVVNKFKQLVEKYDVVNVRKDGDVKVEQLKVSDNDTSKGMEAALLDWRFNLIFTPEQMLNNLNSTNLFMYTGQKDVLCDDVFLFNKLLAAIGVKVDHYHDEQVGHGPILWCHRPGPNQMVAKFLENVKNTV